MKRLPLVLFFVALPAFAQISVTPGEPVKTAAPAAEAAPKSSGNSSAHSTPTPTPSAKREQTIKRAVAVSPTPSATPRRPSAMGRFFRWAFVWGGHKTPQATTPTPSPAPVHQGKAAAPKKAKTLPSVTAPVPTPSATPHPAKPAASPKPATSPKPVATPKPTATPEATPAVTASVVAPKSTHKAESHATPPAAVPDESTAPVVEPSTDEEVGDSSSSEETDARYKQLREQAATDPHVVALHKKMEAAHPGSAYKAAAHQYIKALFSQIRAMDPKTGQAVRRKEGAYNRRIDEGKSLAD